MALYLVLAIAVVALIGVSLGWNARPQPVEVRPDNLAQFPIRERDSDEAA
jgi:hypothetical protein